jgi:hypothetical protein
MLSLADISPVVALQFPIIIASARSLFCSFVNVDGRPYLSASTTLVHLLLNISIRSWQTVLSILSSQLSMDPCLFHSFRHQNRSIACCLSLVQNSSGTFIFTPCSLRTNGLQLNHTRSMSPSGFELQHDRPQQ